MYNNSNSIKCYIFLKLQFIVLVSNWIFASRLLKHVLNECFVYSGINWLKFLKEL